MTNDADKNGYAAHTYDQEIATDAYKASDATCTAKATYYKSCICGARGTETFESGDIDADNHTTGGWQSNRLYHWKVCAACGEKVGEVRHNYGTDRTCDTCGYVKPRPSNPPTPSQPTDTTTKSPDTGDMGIALYAGMTILSLTGGAWVVNKKRKGK